MNRSSTIRLSVVDPPYGTGRRGPHGASGEPVREARPGGFRAGHSHRNQALIARLSNQVGVLQRRLWQAQAESTLAIVAAVEAKDTYTRHHSVHVSYYAERLAHAMDLPPDQIEVIKTAALLHDVGKIGIPDAVLTKPGPLTAEEFSLIKAHPGMGADIVGEATYLRRELPLVLHHHEWYNGRGYPRGLKGRRIPLGARILQVSDSLDAMLLPRSYRRARSVDEVAFELRQGRSNQFDPDIADTALRWLRDHPDDLITESGFPERVFEERSQEQRHAGTEPRP